MKLFGMVMLVVGVALCAAFGGRMSPEMYDYVEAEGEVVFRSGAVSAAFDTYCNALIEAELPMADGCVDPDAEPAAEPEPTEDSEDSDEAAEPEVEPEPPTYDELVASGEAEVEALRAGGRDLPDDIAELRTTWVDAKAALVAPSARLATTPLPAPSERLSGWLSLAGLPFGIGLVLLVIGSVISRRAIKEATQTGGTTGTKVINFAEVLGDVQQQLGTIREDMQAVASPTEKQMNTIKGRVETLQFGPIAELVSARKSAPEPIRSGRVRQRVQPVFGR